MVDPCDFIKEYVYPAIELYRMNRTTKHLAIHAMSQVDVLAAVLALWVAQKPALGRGEESKFREELGAREPAINLIRDAHDCHKHGGLDRKSATASDGQRPTPKTEFGFFVDHTFVGGPLTPYDVLVFVQDDRTASEVVTMLHDAMQAWGRELGRHKMSMPPDGEYSSVDVT